MAENVEETQEMKRVEALIRRRKWQIQELKLKRTKSQTAGKDKDGKDVLVDQSVSRKRVVRKCEFPEREEADNAVKFLTSDACLDYLRLCGAELNSAVGEDADAKIEWVPIQAWYSEEDATNQHARKGMLYHVLKIRGDDGKGEGPYVTQDGCKYQEEYTFFWDVDAPPEVPKGRSGVQYELDVKRREDEDGLGGLYDCVLVKRVTVEQDVFPYDAHMELGETQVVAQMLGVSDDSDLVVDDKGTKGKSIDDKLSAFAEEHGLKLVDEAVTEEVTKDGKTEIKTLHGMVVDITKEKNADCTTSITIRNTKEEENLNSTVVAEVTARSIKTTTIDENVPAEETEGSDEKYPQVAVDETNGVVTRKTVTKTKGGVRTIQTEKTAGVKVDEGKGTVICERTLFEHQHTTIAEAQPTPTTKEAGDASGGKHKRIQSTLRDDGKFDVQTTETEELEVEGAVVHKSKTGTQFVEDVTDKNSTETEESVTLGTGEGVDDNKIAEVQVTKTPGGRKDIRTITRTPIKKDAKIKFREVKRGRSVTQETLFVFENYTAEELEGTATKAGLAAQYDGGSLRINEFGLYDGQFTTTEYSTATDDDDPEPSPDEYWEAVERQDVDVVSFNGGVYKRTTFWIDVDAYTSKSRKEIYEALKSAKEVSVAAADREQRHFNVKAESPRWYRYQSLTSSDDRIIGKEYKVTDLGGKDTTE